MYYNPKEEEGSRGRVLSSNGRETEGNGESFLGFCSCIRDGAEKTQRLLNSTHRERIKEMKSVFFIISDTDSSPSPTQIPGRFFMVLHINRSGESVTEIRDKLVDDSIGKKKLRFSTQEGTCRSKVS
ncbi:hypothetical protein NE237_014767 [Protea cynaroides]|uniref:Uncharacterized protein n=1 Tax=Protea cynaroides TaxID=273540 RepID=A0A9Q0KCN9_9MAGN|nr:hypothetical protein NE237_014767 [Protea cynaroides]